MPVPKEIYPVFFQRLIQPILLASAFICVNLAFLPPLAAQTTSPGKAPLAAKLAFTKNGISGITAKTPYTIEAIRKALPGYDIVQRTRQVEGDTETYIIAGLNGQLVLEIDSYGLHVQIIGTKSPFVSGPHGFHVSERFGAINNKVQLQNECMRGAEESVHKVICTASEGQIQYIVSIPYVAKREPEVWTLAMISPETRLTEMRWIAPEPEDPGPDAATLPAPVIGPASPAMNVGQLLQQGDILVQRAEAARAQAFYLEAAKKGSAIAFYKIGGLYESGNGVVQNSNGAIAYYDRAAALGFIKALSRIVVIQVRHKNIAGAVKSFFRYFRINPEAAIIDAKSWSGDVPRTVQNTLKASGHYRGDIDGKLGPETRAAISAYLNGQPAVPSAQKQPKTAGRGAGDLAARLQGQLQRVACYHGIIDGKWGSGSARALRNFNHWAGSDLSVDIPTSQALRAVMEERDAICGLD